MSEPLHVPKDCKTDEPIEQVKGGWIAQVLTDDGKKFLFMPRELNSDIEDTHYHGFEVNHG